MNIFQANKALTALTKQFTAAGLKIEDFLAADDDTALQAHLASLTKTVADPKVAQDLTSALAKVSAFETAITKFGATIKASDEKAGLTSADIEASIKARASIMAADQLAKHGLKAPLDLTPSADSTKPDAPAKPALFGLEKVQAAFAAESAARPARN